MEDMYKNVLWRYSQDPSVIYDSCQPLRLTEGLLYFDQSVLPIDLASQNWVYQALCYQDRPVLSATNFNLEEMGIKRTPMSVSSWSKFLRSAGPGDLGNEYKFSIFPIVYSLCAATVITCFLTVVLFTKRYLKSQRPSLLLKLSSSMSSIQLIAIYIYTLCNLTNQHNRGEASLDLLIHDIGDKVGFNVVYLICYLLLQFTQVQLIIRLYPRTKEKRVIFFAGIFFSIICQAIWACSIFLVDKTTLSKVSSEDDSALAIIPAFIYLMRISLSVIYTCLVLAYCFVKRNYAFKDEVKMLSFSMVIAINLSVGFFIADVADSWVAEASDVFNITCYVVSNIVSWEWINRIHQFERFKQKEGILGRQFYEDEINNNVINDDDGMSFVSRISNPLYHQRNLTYTSSSNTAKKLKRAPNKYMKRKSSKKRGTLSTMAKPYIDKFNEYVDRFIAFGFVYPNHPTNTFSYFGSIGEWISKKMGLNTSPSHATRGKPANTSLSDSRDISMNTHGTGGHIHRLTHGESRQNNDIYVYSPKAVDMDATIIPRPRPTHYPNITEQR